MAECLDHPLLPKTAEEEDPDWVDIPDANIASEGESNNSIRQGASIQIGDESHNAAHGPTEPGQTSHGEDKQGQPSEGRQNRSTVIQLKTLQSSEAHKSCLEYVSGGSPPDILPQAAIPKTKVYFYLLIFGEQPVTYPEIRIKDQNLDPMPLFPVEVEGEKNLWYCSVTFDQDPTISKVKFIYGITDNNPNSKICEEAYEREIKRVQFDVFRFPDGKDDRNKTVSRARMCYSKFFLQYVKDSTIIDILSYIDGYSFEKITKDYAKELAQWILEQAVQSSTTVMQRLYLCMVLNSLVDHKTVKLSDYNVTKLVCDRFLECLAAFHSELRFSKLVLRLSKKFATFLVKNSSSPGWLTLAAHFYPHLEIKFLFEKYEKYSHHKYDKEKYDEMAKLLLSFLTVENQKHNQEFLRLVVKSAPNMVAVIKLFEIPELFSEKLFSTEGEAGNFFVEFFWKEEILKKKKATSLEKLQLFHQMPDKVRKNGKFQNELFSTLLTYVKSNNELSEVFLELILDLSKDQLIKLLKELSKSVSRHYFLPEILNYKPLKDIWLRISNEDVFDICCSWIETRMIYIKRTNALGSKDKAVAVFKSIHTIMQCSLNASIDESYAKERFAPVVEHILKNQDPDGVLEAFDIIEKLSSVAQKCYLSHIREKLTPMLIKSSSDKLKKYSGSSLGRELLSCVLEVIDVPKFVEGGEVNEREFFKILAWWHIWIILLGANTASAQAKSTSGKHRSHPSEEDLTDSQTLENSKKFQDGRNVCHQLKDCIEEGNTSLELTNILHDQKVEVSELCAAVLRKCDSRQYFEDMICALMQAEKDCAENIQLLKSLIDYVKKLSNKLGYHIDGIETVEETLENLDKTWRERKINELQDDTFWGELHPLLSKAKTLQPLIYSLSFMAVAKNSLQRPRDIYSLINFLSTEAVQEFHRQWNDLLTNLETTTVETMDTLLGSPKNQIELDKELEVIGKHFGGDISSSDEHVESCNYRELFSRAKCYMQDCVQCPNVLKQVQHVIAIFKIFKLTDRSKKEMPVLAQFPDTLENINKLALAELHKLMKTVNKAIPFLSEIDLGDVTEELSRPSDLLGFIEEIVNEDIRFLIDAVEEHSDQFVSESLVSDLIEIHGFLAALIERSNEEQTSALTFLELLKNSRDSGRKMADKIHQCSVNVNSLRGLYTSVANRGQVTKEIISNCLNRGEYTMSQKDGKCDTNISYVLQEGGDSKTCKYSLSELQDLRSRAHLIVTSRRHAIRFQSNHTEESNAVIKFDNFINQVNLLTEISTLLSKLRLSGYPNFRSFEQKIKTTSDHQTNNEFEATNDPWARHKFQIRNDLRTTNDLQTTKELQNTRDSLQQDLNNWEEELQKARKDLYFLNYYRSDQICTLYDFLMDSSQDNFDEVLPLIYFVLRNDAKKHQLEQNQKLHKKSQKPDSNVTPNLLLSTVGKALENIFGMTKHPVRLIPGNGQSESYYTKQEATVTPGKIFVAILEPDSPLTANVILSLYQNTSSAFPEPYEIVFCSSRTTWEELHLLLQRCFTHSKYRPQYSLFCIANVELLPNELQLRLVDVIEEKMESGIEKDVDFQLALICCGGDHHHIVEQFAQYSHHIAGMTDLALTNCLESSWPDVKVITSTLPGLGKTETIKREAAEKSKNVATLPISGPFEPSKLLKRLKELDLHDYHCLHLDIGEVNDPLSLHTFLFQLIVTGMVSAGSHFYHLPTTHVYIEIANTLEDSLRKSLVVLNNFTRIHLKGPIYEDLFVSSEITSNVQVVCQYLDIFDRACIHSQEVHFSGPKRTSAQPTDRCRELLAKYFSSYTCLTFTTLHTILGVLANQLLTFSKSTFFKIESLKYMVGNEGTSVRKDLFEALLEVSKQFACNISCSSGTRNLSQEECAKALDEATTSTADCLSAENMVGQAQKIAQWEDSNHLVVVFHGLNSQAITAMYRNKDDVPENIKKLLTSQGFEGNEELEDFDKYTQVQLQMKLEKIACGIKQSGKENLFEEYALTPDNILKMILIILRVRANIPVIIMGETGCGKTSLVCYLANTCGVQFYTFNVHAGRSEEEIIAFIKEKERHARDSDEHIWIFLDEINTCDHLGLISDIMCHHSLLGRPLSKSLVFLAACNPYKLRPEEHINTAGLEGKTVTDEYSKLVYRVQQLPEAMVDYVWDYGSLTSEDERAYIGRMVKNQPPERQEMLINLLSASQRFIRDTEKNPFCVSLRDVRRCITLINWFEKMNRKRQNVNKSDVKDTYTKHTPMEKIIVLALAHSYWFRLPTAELRKKYEEEITKFFSCEECKMKMTSKCFSDIVRMEGKDYLDRMELPPGTARNTALRENVFVMLVCILNRIPVFVVGKPGCSKSLSIQLIQSNLRGRDSQNPLFKVLPQLYVVSYQGSESSTSEGIEKVFDKARKYKDHNKDILPVVLLDEVGLAENSKYNPLKVLHNLLEPGDGKPPDVAVVGISNWSLDAAKMNRAIHLSIPEPTIEDLLETGRSILHGDSAELQCLTEGYVENQAKQNRANFHGLRDYYSLIKSLNGHHDFQKINKCLQRNFGGLPGEVTKIQTIFREKLKKLTSSPQDNIPVTELIQENLEDLHARHLMLITSEDSAICILKQSLDQQEKEIVTIYGSRFEEDQSEEYSYRILSRIILCMEQKCILILKDLERIYGSLYNMLNQNYVVVGRRKNCRVALGAYTNPMCQVNDEFRCIVLIDQHRVDYTDPPFLNRFEKQVLRFSDVLTDNQQHVVTELDNWVQAMSTIDGLEFVKTDMFVGFHEATLPSLVLLQSNDTESSREELLKKCKDDLMWIASPDGVLRTSRSKLSKRNHRELQELCDEYFKKPLHQGLASFMKHVVSEHSKSCFFSGDKIGSKTVVITFASIHTDIRQCLGSAFKCQVERLSAYKSEKQLTVRINEFWNAPEKTLFVLQCKPDLDGTHLSFATSIIEKERNSYKQCLSEENLQGSKHLCIVVHVKRGEDTERKREEDTERKRGEDTQKTRGVRWQFNFLSGWRQVFLDVLEAPLVPLNEIIGKRVREFLSTIDVQGIARKQLSWCFSCIKYTHRQRSTDTILNIAKNLLNSEAVSQKIIELILNLIDKIAEKDWQVEIACNPGSLVNSSTLYCAMKLFVSRLVRDQLAKIVYFLEKENAWPPHLAKDSNEILTPMLEELEELWCKRVMSDASSEISEIPEPRGIESYCLLSTSLTPCVLVSHIVIREVNDVKELFLEDYKKLLANEDYFDDNNQLKQTVQQEQLERFSKIIINRVPELRSFTSPKRRGLYLNDTFDTLTAEFSPMLSRHLRASIVEAMFVFEVKQNLPVKDVHEFFTLLHMFTWLHRRKVLDLLRMVDRCQPFIGLDVVERVMELCSSKIMFRTHFSEEPCTNERSGSGKPSDTFETTEPTTVANESTCDMSSHKTEPKANETEKEGQDVEHFGDKLVGAYCKEMFPSKSIIEKNGGIESWARNVSIFLSLALKVCERPLAFHFLRLCVDFARTVFTPITLPTSLSSLYTLNEIGAGLAPEYLNHEDSFEIITNQLVEPLKRDMVDQKNKQEGLEKFLALFYARCIDTNVDTSNARPIVEHVLSLTRPELVMMMSPVVLRLLMVEKKASPEIFRDILTNPSAIEDCPCLQNIEEVFEDHRSNGLIDCESYPAVMICDLIQRLSQSCKDELKTNDIYSSDGEVINLVKSAIEIVAQTSEDNIGLRVLSAVAYLREFLTLVAQLIAKNSYVLRKDSSNIDLVTEVNSLLTNDESYLKCFFLKQLYEHQSLFDLQKWIAKNNALPAKELWLKLKCHDKALFTIVFKYPEYEEAKAALWKKLKDDDSLMQEFLKKCLKSPNHAFVLLGVLINKVYLKRAAQTPADKERLTEWVAQNVDLFSECKLYQELLLSLLGKRDFYGSQLKLSTDSPVDKVQLALLVLHIASVVATSALDQKLPLYRYFTNPGERPCILAHCKEDIRSVFEHQSPIKESICVTCVCRSRLAFESNVNERICPNCQKVPIDEISTPPETSTSPMSRIDAKSDEWDLCTKHMSPAVYRALHLIVYSSFYAGVALQTTSEKQLSSVVQMLYKDYPDSDSPKTTSEKDGSKRSLDPASFCFEKIETDLSHLMKILNCKKNVAINILHLVVERSSDLIRSKNLLGENDCSTPNMCRKWEFEFSKRTENLFLNAREMSKEVEEMTAEPFRQSKEITLTHELLELDSYPEESDKQKKQLKRLFRMTKQPSFEDLRSAFLLSPKHVKEKHGFLMLFFAQFDQLQIIGNLHHLLKWSRLVSSELTHRISRKDAKSKSIADFINGDHLKFDRSEKEKEKLKLLFSNYKKAWDNMRDLVNLNPVNKEDVMPSLDDTGFVGFCLTESEYGIYLQMAIEILVSYQNSILDAMISLSSKTRHPALSFLENDNGSSWVMSTSIQEVGEQEIIHFQRSSFDLFKYAQNDPEYGKGQQIKYDFEQIELELGKKIAFGKCYLTETLNKFIFAGEMFHSCGPLLTEIRSLMVQSRNLPKEVSDILSKMQEKKKNAQDLLPHIEVLIYLLKRKLKDVEVEMTVENLAKKWSLMLPSPFPVELLPEPGRSHQTKHVTGPQSSLRVKHLLALYEALEDVLADGAIEGLTPKFKEKLPEELEKILASQGERFPQLEPQNFLKVLRRFVFRYLSLEAIKYWPEESTTLQSCLNDPSLWFPRHDQPPKLDAISHEFTLKYIFSMVKYLEGLSNKNNRLDSCKRIREPPHEENNPKSSRRSRAVPRKSRTSNRHSPYDDPD